MLKKFFFLLEEFTTTSAVEIGEQAKLLAKLRSIGVHTPKCVVIPKNTLKIIAQANNINAKTLKIIQATDFQSILAKNKSAIKLSKLIKKQRIPKELAKEFLKIYHTYLNSGFVDISNSSNLKTLNVSIKNVKGDANIIDVILELWANIVIHKLKTSRTKNVNISQLLYPTQILIKQAIEAEVSGVAYTFDIRDGDKHRATIKSCYGIYDENRSNQLDIFISDIKTTNIVKKVITKQDVQYKRSNEHLKEITTKKKLQALQTLKLKQVQQLTSTLLKIKRFSLNHYQVYWGLIQDTLYIDDIQTTIVEKTTSQQQDVKNKMQIFAAVNNLNSINKYMENIDGIAVLNTGQLLTVLGEHPIHVARNKHRKYLVKAIVETIKKYLKVNKKLNLIYRSQNLTTLDLNKLQHATNYENTEINPDLGCRGGYKILAQPELFKFELSIIEELLQTTKNKICLTLPFVRSPQEANNIIKLLTKSGLTKHKNFEVWLEISTPENILNIANYPLKQLSGLVFNTHNIHSLLLGIDQKNPEVYHHYKKNINLLHTLLKSLISIVELNTTTFSIHEKIKILLDLTEFDDKLLAQLLQTKIQGIIVNPEVTSITKECIINTENNSLN